MIARYFIDDVGCVFEVHLQQWLANLWRTERQKLLVVPRSINKSILYYAFALLRIIVFELDYLSYSGKENCLYGIPYDVFRIVNNNREHSANCGIIFGLSSWRFAESNADGTPNSLPAKSGILYSHINWPVLTWLLGGSYSGSEYQWY